MKLAFHMGYASLSDKNYGSEIALLSLAKQFQIYYDVTIYSSNCMTEQFIEGVRYTRPGAVITDDILIISRYMCVFVDHTIKSQKVYIWVHDTTFQPFYSGQVMKDNGAHLFSNMENKIDGVIVLTEFHKQLMRRNYSIPENKIHVIGNAIMTHKFLDQNITKDRYKFIYTSCPKRGLDVLLKLFPVIHGEFPEAQLYIYRGDESFTEGQREEMKKYPYIHYMGAKSNDVVIQEFLSAGVWLYPTNFVETYCISALEAQMAGCMCITSQLGSLPEIIGNRGVVVMSEYNSTQYIEDVLRSVRVFLKTDLYDNKVASGRKWAIEQNWENACRKWLTVMKEEPMPYAHVINLARQPEKWKECETRLNAVGLKYERFEAVDGCELEWGEELQKYFILKEDSYNYIPYQGNVGIFGCAMSHIRLWEKLSQLPDNTTWMIAEDDVYFGDNFNMEWNAVYGSIRNDDRWDICYLGYTFTAETLLDTDVKINDRVYELVKLDKRKDGGGTFCYVMRAKCAKKLLEIIKTSRVCRAIDWFMIDSYDKIKAYICNPLIVTHRTPFTAVQGSQKTLKGLPPPFESVDKIVYINLEKRVDRNTQIMRELKNVSQNKILRFNAIESDPGYIGCSKSHIEVLKMAIKNNWKSYLVVEDDMIWVDFENGYKRFLSLPETRDVVMLGCHNFKTHGLRVTKGQGGHAYIVYNHYYLVLLANMEEAFDKLLKDPTNYQSFALDIYFNKLQERDNWLVVNPPMCLQRPGYSDIEKRLVDYRSMSNYD
jgi:glycosyl transferase family 25